MTKSEVKVIWALYLFFFNYLFVDFC